MGRRLFSSERNSDEIGAHSISNDTPISQEEAFLLSSRSAEE
jgi:hypothetical protein